MKQKTKASLPAYLKIAAILREQIFSGSIIPGDILPSENLLCEQYKVSRDTIRKGLAQLENENLIYSRPKVGYFVSSPKHSEYLLEFPEDSEGTTSKFRDVHAIIPDERLCMALQIEPGHKVIEMSQVIYSDSGSPIAWDIKFVPFNRAYPSVETEMQYAVFPGPVALKVAPYDSYTEIDISAAIADQQISEILECREGDPLLLIQRTYIKRDGQRLSFGQRYLRQDFGRLTGISDFKSYKNFR